TPALSYVLLPKALDTAREPAYVVRLKERYARLLHTVSNRPRRLMVAAGGLCLLAIAAVPFLGGEFLPPLREGHFIVHMVTLPGTALPESMRLGALVSAELLKNPNVRLVAQQIGRAEQGDDTPGVHYSEIHVDLKPLGGSAA